MKKIILDTDIGVDCDDAIAVALLAALKKQGLCDILAMTTCTARTGATSALKAVLDYYGEEDIPCGRMYSPFLPCDSINNYAELLMKKYRKEEAVEDSVRLFRKTLAKSEDKISVIAIGPLTVIAGVLNSGADEFSPLTGEELFREKVKDVYTMSCRFPEKEIREAEWNVYQDIFAAKTFFDRCPVPLYVCPGELGDEVYTGGHLSDRENHPVADSIIAFFEKNGINQEKTGRESWDPCTCYAAVLGTEEFELSERGVVSIDDGGVSAFKPIESGKHVILRKAKDARKLAARIDGYIG